MIRTAAEGSFACLLWEALFEEEVMVRVRGVEGIIEIQSHLAQIKRVVRKGSMVEELL